MDKSLGPTFSTVEHLERVYSRNFPEFTFCASSLEEWQEWRVNLRQRIKAVLGGFPEKCELKAKVVERKEVEGYYIEKIILQVEQGLLMPAYFLIPEGIKFPAPVVLALHGHGRGADDVLGEYGSEVWQKWIRDYNYDYARQLVQKGFITFVPEVRGFGDREKESEKIVNPREEGNYGTSCRKASFNAILLGQPILGRKIWDIMRSIDYLETRKEIDSERIGCLGLSMGGTIALFSSAMEERIKVVVISCCLNTFRDSIMAIEHCECNYIPYILQYAEMYDICGLIAPRPLLIEAAKDDPIFPFHATQFAFNKVREVYRLLGEEDKLNQDFFEGGHRFSGKKSFDWLKKWLFEE